MTILEKLEDMLREGKITRREFLTKASALGVAAAISPAILGSKAEAAAPKKGGRLRIGMQGGFIYGKDSLSIMMDQLIWALTMICN